MSGNMSIKTYIVTLLAIPAIAVKAQNPFVQTWYTSDPAPMVHDGTLYVYTGHDEDGADFFWMQEWRVYSTRDMVNWRDHGSPLALESFSWADDRAWASQTIERDGRFYWYICAHSKISGGMAIGVAVSDSPTGPFRDAIGKPLYEDGSWDHIDPTVFIDDDQQAWLMWGNPRVYYCKLNRDMTSIDGTVQRLLMTEKGFGAPDPDVRQEGKRYRDCYTEGPWLTKRNGKYQLLYAAGGVPEHIAYSTAPSPVGPWTYAGEIMSLTDTGSFTNHCGVTDYKGHSYFFYHTGHLPGGGGFGRSVAVEEFRYNADGSFPIIHPTAQGVQPVGTLTPYARVEAETMAFSHGVKTEQGDATGVYVTDIHHGDYIKLQAVDFGQKGPRTFTACVASGLRGGAIELHTDSLGGPLLGRLSVPATGGWLQWQTLNTELSATATGVHDLYLVFSGRKGPKLFNFDWWQLHTGLAAHTETVTNPMLWADVPDPDVIRVGDAYYMVSTTMHLMPGAPIMRSYDLKNWQTVSYLFDRLTDSPRYDMQQGTAYGRGQWATSLKYHNGRFYALFAPNDQPGGDTYIYTAEKAEGKWTLLFRMRHFHDASLFFDDDGSPYVIYGTGQLVRLTPDLHDVVAGSERQLFERDSTETALLEGSRMVKYQGRYYLLMISWPAGQPRRQVCYRADRIEGPYEKHVILQSEFGGFSYVGQGTIVDTPAGDWYGIIFQDRGGVGRVPLLMPCRWTDGWPMLGDADGHVPDSVMVSGGKGAPTPLVVSDSFDTTEPGLHWQWNHNPVSGAWSLTERPGYLRLKTSRVVSNLYLAPNTLTQRMEGPLCSATVQLDASQLKEGDCAGLAAFNSHSGVLTVERRNGKLWLSQSAQEVKLSEREKAVEQVLVDEHQRIRLRRPTVWLRIDADFRPATDMATSYYSLDGHQWTPVGRPFHMQFDWRRLFMGTKYALFCYATQSTGGYADFDDFNYQKQ